VKNAQHQVLSLLATLAFSCVTQVQSSESAPIFKITPVASKVTFYVKASVKLEGTFDKWDATLVFTSTDASTGVLDIKIQADSVHTGSTSKDNQTEGRTLLRRGEKSVYNVSFHEDHTDQSQHSRCCRNVYPSWHLETRVLNVHR
jgi:hypothetical protein